MCTMLKRLVVIVSFIFIWAAMNMSGTAVRAQASTLPGVYGNEFWLGFLSNNRTEPGDQTLKITLYAVSESPVTITAKQGSSVLSTFTEVSGGQQYFYKLENLSPSGLCPSPEESETISQRGICISSANKSQLFSCYAVIEVGGTSANYKSDVTLLLPKDVLGSEYFVQPYPDDGLSTEFIVVATEDETKVDIVPHCITYNGASAGSTLSVTLNKGQTYMVKSQQKKNDKDTVDLGGSTICADKPIAVFNGNEAVKIPNEGAYSANHTFEQNIPHTMWGTEFYVSRAGHTLRNRVQITASYDNTEVTCITASGTKVYTLNRGQGFVADEELNPGAVETLQLNSTNQTLIIRATKPILCYTYLGCGADNQETVSVEGKDVTYNWGNPTNALIVPWTHRAKEMSFYTHELPNQTSKDVQKYFVQVVTRKSDAGKVTIDGILLPSTAFTAFAGDANMVYTNYELTTHGKHRITTTGKGFTGFVHGMTSKARAYEYTLGFDPPTYPDSLFVRDRDNPVLNIMSPYSYEIDSVKGKGYYQRQEDWWPIGQERLDTAYVCNGEWLRFQGQMAVQNSTDSVMWKIYKCKPNGKRDKNPIKEYHTVADINHNHFYNFQFTVDPQEDLPPAERDPYQLYAVDMERYKMHLICTDLEPECDTLRTMVKALRAYNDTTWKIVCEHDTVQFFFDNYNHGKVGPKAKTVFQFNYTGTDPDIVPFYKGHNIWTRQYQTPNGCDSTVTLCIFGCDTSLQIVDTTICESQLKQAANGMYSFTMRDKNGHNRSFAPITVQSQAELLAKAQTPAGIEPYSKDYVAAQFMSSCLDITPTMPQPDKDTINMYKKHCPNFKGCPDTVKLHLTIMPRLYYPEQSPAIVPWCTGGDKTATYTEWKDARGNMIREILQTDTAFLNPAHLDLGYFRDTIWYTPCPDCPKGGCPKEITTLALLKVDNEPKVHDVHICRDESYTHEAFMEEDRKLLNGWVIWDTLIAPGAEYYSESHMVDVKDAGGTVRCQYKETLHLYVHPTYANKGDKFNTELSFKDTVCINDHYEWENHTEALPGQVRYVWDVKRGKRVPAADIPTDVAGTFEFVDSLKTKTCTTCHYTAGCDSIWRLTLIVGNKDHFTDDSILCQNKAFTYNFDGVDYYYYGENYTGTKQTVHAKTLYNKDFLNKTCDGTIYFDTTFHTLSRYGCDSARTLRIHLDSVYVTKKDTFICEGTEYHFFDETFVWWYDRTPGATNIHEKFKGVATQCGCDSGVTHYIHVRPVYHLADKPDTTCQAAGEFYAWIDHPRPGDMPRQIWMVDELHGGKTAVMTNAIPTDVAGTFTLIDSLRTVTCDECVGKNGCDSIVSISLTIIPTYNMPEVIYPLSSEVYFLWDDTAFIGNPAVVPPAGYHVEYVPGSGTYTHHYGTKQTVDGHSTGTHYCDSLFTYHIVVGEVFRDTVYDAVCSNCEYKWHMEDPHTGATKDSIITNVPIAGDTAWYSYDLKTSLGFDSIYNLCLTGFPTKYNKEKATVCQGDRFVWEEHSDMFGKNAYIYLVDATGATKKIDTTTFNDTISRQFGPYLVRDSLHTDTLFTDPFGNTKPMECDSIWELELYVSPTYTYQYNYDKVLFDKDLCSNETLLWNNRLFVGYDYDHAAHPLTPASSSTPYDSIVYIPRDSAYSYYDSVPYPLGTHNYRCDSINYLQITISKFDTTHVREVLGDNNKTWYFGGKGGTFQYRDSLGNLKDRVTVRDLVHDIPLGPGGLMRDTFLIDTLRLDGCDSIIWDSIYIYKTYEFTFDTLICSNIEWSWRPESPNADKFKLLNYRGSGTYCDSLKTHIGGVDSVYVLHLLVQPSSRHVITDSICKNDTINWEFQRVYYKPEVVEWEVHYSTGAKCDSVMVLRAKWFDYYHMKPDTIPGDTICRYDDVVWVTPGETKPHTMALRGEKGEIFDKVPTDTIMKDASGKDIGFWMTIYDSLHTVGCGCDSTYTLRYYVRPAYHFHDEVSICSTDTFRWRGMELFSPTAARVDTADRYVMADGTCDSIYFLTLHINQAYDSIFYDTICANQKSFEWQGHNLDAWLALHKNDSLPIDTFLWRDYKTTALCDSLYKLYLTVWPIVTDTVKDTICVGEVYDLNGRPLTRSGVYFDTLLNKFGCDSFVVLYLEVVPVTKFQIEPLTVCADEGAYDMIFTFDATKGIPPRELKVVYDSLAKANGFPEDTVFVKVTGTTVRMDLPNIVPYVKPNQYSARIYFDNGTCNDEELLRVDFNFSVRYPSWLLEQHWMDAIGLLNEKYNYGEGNEGFIFTSYQWYKNGEALVGQTRPYLYMPHLLEPGAEYSVALVREGEDVSVMSCPIVAQKRDNDVVPQKPYVSVVPTYVVKANPVVNILCSQHGGTYKLYNPFGSLIDSGEFAPGEHNAYEVKLPAVSGVYMFQLNQDEGEIRTVKVIVN